MVPFIETDDETVCRSHRKKAAVNDCRLSNACLILLLRNILWF